MYDEVVVNMNLMKDREPVKAMADVTLNTEIGVLTITQFKIIQKEDDDPWVALPQIRYKDNNGDYKNIDILVDCRKFRREISDILLAEYSKLTS